MNPPFSLIHATWHRPKEAAAAMRLWRDRAHTPSSVEYILCADVDDTTRFDLIEETLPIEFGRPQAFVEHPGSGSAKAWDFAAKFSTGDLLVQVSDDFVPPQNWDALILDAIITRGGGLDWDTKALVVRVGEHYRKDDLMTMAICSRKYYKMQGEFLHAGYQSVFSDDEFTIRSVAAARDGACIIIDARDVVFRHENPYHTGAPQDETLKRQNSEGAYAEGVKLFVDRNWRLINAGLKTW